MSGSKKRKPTRNTVHKVNTTKSNDDKKLNSSEIKEVENFESNNDNIMEENAEKADKTLDPVLANLISNPANLYPFLFQSANNTPSLRSTKTVASPSAINNNNFFTDNFQKDEIEEVFYFLITIVIFFRMRKEILLIRILRFHVVIIVIPLKQRRGDVIKLEN